MSTKKPARTPRATPASAAAKRASSATPKRAAASKAAAPKKPATAGRQHRCRRQAERAP